MTDPQILNNKYWNKRYNNQTDKWDVGEITTPLKQYFNQLTDKSIAILIPGAGRSYEAEYLWLNGFKNVYLLDYSNIALQEFRNRVPNFPESHLIATNFFEHTLQYDLIIEQTFFCALHPSLRDKYVQHIYQILKPKGKLVGLLFLETTTNTEPPFGGKKSEYVNYFTSLFNIKIMDICYNSIPPRAERELFINLVKK